MKHRVGTKWAMAVCMLLVALSVTAVASAAEGDAKKAPASAVDLNSASVEELQTLPGVGPALAGRIVEFRKEHGNFERVEDLMKVKGIGEKSFQKLRPHVTVGKKR